jgi:hypothetical protein
MKPRTRSTFPHIAATALAVATTALLTACASGPTVTTQWTDPQLGARSGLLRGARVLIACNADDRTVLQICQDQLAAEVVARGATPVLAAADTVLTNDRAIDGQLLPSARRDNARALFVITLAPASTERSPGLSIGIGGFGIGRNSGVGVGVSAPVGGGRVTTGYAANGRVTDAGSGRLVWSATASAPPSADLPAQFAALAKTVVGSADQAGLF